MIRDDDFPIHLILYNIYIYAYSNHSHHYFNLSICAYEYIKIAYTLEVILHYTRNIYDKKNN